MTLNAKIYQPCKTSMQSGTRNTKHWVLEYLPNVKKSPDPLMGWSSGGTLEQIHLEFDSKDEAITYADKHSISYEVLEPKKRKITPKAYADNFANARTLPF